ncbi:hypothetical protein [Cedecea colo]|uniref:hypothetical protein n=1 Tax=Cedecea colo TaxID=2552946 RepID=UPI00142FCFE9|nr:hypothetical protein [Cedecea colo]
MLIPLAARHPATVDRWTETKVARMNPLTPHVADAASVPLLTQTATSGNFMNVDIGYPLQSTATTHRESWRVSREVKLLTISGISR